MLLFAVTGCCLLGLALTRHFTSAERSVARITRNYHRRLLRELPAALASGDAFIAYQPKIALRTGELDGLEALIRWQHPRFGNVERGTLIALIDRAGQMRELSTWVLRRAIADQLRLSRAGYHVSVHINISGGQLTDAAFVQEACMLAETAGGTIGFEITETVFIENQQVALANLERFVAQGIRLSIDDYGSGLSSLAYLKQLPVHEIKIDKMFISGMTNSHRDPLIVRSTIDLAHALGMLVVGEGVESAATLALLRVMGCDYAQGFLISQPLPIDELIEFLAADTYRQRLADAEVTIRPPKAFWTRTGRDPVDESTSEQTEIVQIKPVSRVP